MKIKQVEELVGITSKNIRFYESQGLIIPERAENGYREYRQKNIDTLKKIKLLRKLGVSVDEIKSVLSECTSLEECLERHIDILEKERDNLTNMLAPTTAILEKKCTMHTLETDEWLEEMERMEKEGIDFVNLSKVDIHMKKKMGAVIGGVVMMMLMAFIIGMILWGNSVDPIPMGLLLFLIGIPAVIIVGIIIVMRGRLKEIEGGEEDEAAKY